MISFLRELAKQQHRYVAWIAVLAALGGFLFGFDTGVIGSAEPYFAPALNIGTFGESWVVGSLLLGAIAGAAISGYLADRISRKWTKCVSGCVFTVAAIASAFPPNVELLCAARFVLGLGVGTASFVAPMYISEHSPKHMRGGMTALNQLMITFGILVAYLSDYGFSGFGATNWRWMFAVEAIPGAALAIAMVFVPHTPRWLMQNGREDEAREVLERVRPAADVDAELDDIRNTVEQQQKTSVRRMLTSSRLRPFLVVGVVLAFLQQAVGINAVLYFGAQDLKYLGLNTGTAVYEAISLGIVNFVFAGIAVLLLDWVGRKPMMLVGSAGMAASLILEGWYFSNSSAFIHANGMIGLGATLAFLAFFEISLGPVFWLMISELFPLRVRSKAMALCTIVNWTFNFFVSYFFLTMTTSLGRNWTFYLFAFFAVCSLVFTIFRVPETKSRSLEQISEQIGAEEQAAQPA